MAGRSLAQCTHRVRSYLTVGVGNGVQRAPGQNIELEMASAQIQSPVCSADTAPTRRTIAYRCGKIFHASVGHQHLLVQPLGYPTLVPNLHG